MKGNEAIAEAALQAGCKAFFGYPITPQSEIPEYLTTRLGMNERALFARMLTAYGIKVEDAGDTFEHIIRRGIQEFYDKRFPDE